MLPNLRMFLANSLCQVGASTAVRSDRGEALVSGHQVQRPRDLSTSHGVANSARSGIIMGARDTRFPLSSLQSGGTTTTSLHEGNQGGPYRANFQASSRTHCLQPRASRPLFGVVIWQHGRSPSTWPGVLLLRVASMRLSYRSSLSLFGSGPLDLCRAPL
jgi:hypothetical protein